MLLLKLLSLGKQVTMHVMAGSKLDQARRFLTFHQTKIFIKQKASEYEAMKTGQH